MPKFIYYPPPVAALRQVAQQLCQRLAVRHADEGYTQYEVIEGLAQFFHLAGKIQAKQLNQQQEVVDNEPKAR